MIIIQGLYRYVLTVLICINTVSTYAYCQDQLIMKSKYDDSIYYRFKDKVDRNIDDAETLLKREVANCKDTCAQIFLIDAMCGYLHEKKGDHNQAILFYTKSLTENPKQKNIFLERSQVYYNMKFWEKSMNDVNKALSLDPNLSVGYYYKSLIFGYGITNIDSALFYINLAIKLDFKNVMFLKYKVNLLYEQKRCEEATEIQFAIMEIDGLTDDNTIVLAELIICSGDIDQALNILLFANKKRESIALTARIAYVYNLKGEYLLSIKYLERLTILDPTNSNVYDDLSHLKYGVGQKNEAIYDLKYRTSKVKNQKAIYELLSDLYLGEKKYDSSLYYINKSLADNVTLNLIEKRAIIYQAKDELNSAYKDYKAILNIDSCNFAALNFTSKYELLKQHFNLSVISASKGINCGFKYELIEVLVQAYFYSGDFKNVNANIDSWLRYYPKNTQALFIKALMKSLDGDFEKSIVFCRMAENYSNTMDDKEDFNRKILMAMNYLAQKNYTSFYEEIDKIVLSNKNFIKKSFVLEEDKTLDTLFKIKMNYLSGFDFYLSITLPENIIQEIYKRYNIK